MRKAIISTEHIPQRRPKTRGGRLDSDRKKKNAHLRIILLLFQMRKAIISTEHIPQCRPKTRGGRLNQDDTYFRVVL
jgi:hypothetical protein